jgi:hypothetical protein
MSKRKKKNKKKHDYEILWGWVHDDCGGAVMVHIKDFATKNPSRFICELCDEIETADEIKLELIHWNIARDEDN